MFRCCFVSYVFLSFFHFHSFFIHVSHMKLGQRYFSLISPWQWWYNKSGISFKSVFFTSSSRCFLRLQVDVFYVFKSVFFTSSSRCFLRLQVGVFYVFKSMFFTSLFFTSSSRCFLRLYQRWKRKFTVIKMVKQLEFIIIRRELIASL